jgi:hypothetical protein
MKYLFLALAVLVMAGPGSAAELFTVDHPAYQGTIPGGVRDAITQNWNTTVIEAVQVACGVAGSYTTQNYYLRRFYFSDYGLSPPVQVTSVIFGVEQLDMADATVPPPYDIAIRLYQISTPQAFLFANLIPIGSATVPVEAGDVGTFLQVPLSATVQGSESEDLVVAIDAPDGSAIGSGLQFRPGANSLGADLDAFLASAACGVDEPVGVSDIGFPDSQTIFVVDVYPGIGPIPTTPTSWGMVKALYR